MSLVTTNERRTRISGDRYILLCVYRNLLTRLIHWPIGHAVIDPIDNTFVFNGIWYGGKGYRSLEEAERRAVEFIEQKARS